MIVDQIIFSRREGCAYRAMDGHPPKPRGKTLTLIVLGKEADGRVFNHGLEIECPDGDELFAISRLLEMLGASFCEIDKARGGTLEERVATALAGPVLLAVP